MVATVSAIGSPWKCLLGNDEGQCLADQRVGLNDNERLVRLTALEFGNQTANRPMQKFDKALEQDVEVLRGPQLLPEDRHGPLDGPSRRQDMRRVTPIREAFRLAQWLT